jgi:hypothetical protein
VLDSPLVAHKEPDPDETDVLPESVKELFCRSLASDRRSGQVIVFENIDPPKDVEPSINYLHFSKSGAGRYGFYSVEAAR